MKSNGTRSLPVIIIAAGLLLAACTPSTPSPAPLPTQTLSPPASQAAPSPTPTIAPTSLPPTAPATLADTTASQPTEPAAPASGEQVSPSPTPTLAPQACDEKAAYFGDVTIPDDTFFAQGEAFTKTWRFRNEGTCTWTPDYKLAFHSGDVMSGPLNQPFPSTVPPGATVELSVDMTAPSRGGLQQGFWWFEDPTGRRFGTGSNRADTFWVRISVRFLDRNDQPQGDPGAQPPPPPPAGCAAQRDAAVEASVLTLVNQNRAANGLAPLSLSTALAEAAFVHSRDMACNRFVDHNGSNGSSWYDRIRAQGYSYSNANENIYVGFPEFGGTAEGAVNWWMNSRVHRENILNAGNLDAGVGYVYDANSEWGGYYTMVFARP